MSNPDLKKMFDAQKAGTELLVAMVRTSFEGMQRLTELNMGKAQEAFSGAVTSATKLASAKDPNAMAQLNQQMPKPEAMMEYWRDVHDIVSTMQKDVTTLMQANYSQLAESVTAAMQQKLPSTVDGGDMISSAMRNMFEQSSKAFENVNVVTAQMTKQAGANLRTATSAIPKAAGSGGKTAKKK